MSWIMQRTALILSDDARDPSELEAILAASGYAVYAIAPVDGSVELTLRETQATLVLAHVDLKRDTLAQPADVAVLGLLLREPTYAAEHVVLVVTRTPDVVETVLGPVLERLGVPVLALPTTPEIARELVELASARLTPQLAGPESLAPTPTATI